MYQSVGQDAVHLIAQAMDLPLYRTEITGQARDQSEDYTRGASLADDETENLTLLLKTVLVRLRSSTSLSKTRSQTLRMCSKPILKWIPCQWVQFCQIISAFE